MMKRLLFNWKVLSLIIVLAGFGFQAQAQNDCTSADEISSEGIYTIETNPYWYKYTAPANGVLILTSVGHTSVDTYVELYSDCSGSLIDSNDQAESTNQSTLIYDISQGEVVYVRWKEYWGATTGFNWELSLVEGSEINDCSTADVITTEGTYSVEIFSNWYKYTAPANGVLTVASEGLTSIDTKVSLFSDCSSSVIADNDNTKGSTQSDLSYEMTQGQEIYILWENNGSNSFDWALSFTNDAVIPVNDCSTAEEITTQGTYTVVGAPYWYKYTAPAAGLLTVTSDGFTDVNTYVELYTDCSSYRVAYNNYSNGGIQSTLNYELAPGEVVYILWDDRNEKNGFDWSLSFQEGLVTNDCATAEEITADGTYSVGITSYWYKYTAPADGVVTVSSDGTSVDTYLELYSGCGSSVLVSNDDGGSGYSSVADYEMTQGEVIYIHWDDKYEITGFNWSLSFNQGATTLTNTCAEAEVISAEGTYTVPEASYWYKYTAPANGEVTISSDGTSVDTYVKLYSDCNSSFITSDDDGGTGVSSILTYQITQGEVIYIKWDELYDTTGFDWSLSFVEEDFTNDCATAEVITTDGTYTVPEASYWYKYTAPANGEVTISSDGTSVDTYVKLYSDCNSSFITSDDDGGSGVSSILTYQITQGEVIYIKWDEFYETTGFDWSLSFVEEDFSNDCATAEVISAEGTYTVPQASYWYKYTAPANGEVTISSEGTSVDTYVFLYSDCSASSIASNDDGGSGYSSVLTYEMTQGEVIYIKWGDNYETTGFDWQLSYEVILSSDEELNASALTLYPVPVDNGALNVQLEKAQSSTVEIYDLTGRIYKSVESNEQTVKINLEGLPRGLYQAVITLDDQKIVKKFIKN